jgi:hypothetical protein
MQSQDIRGISLFNQKEHIELKKYGMPMEYFLQILKNMSNVKTP